MKSLSLYVDKWFITVAINIDRNVMPLSLPSGEDRIWLFFHEDIPNNRIEYGKAFENDYRDQRPHFIGDVFALIREGDHYFTRYEKRREEMKEIFNVSGIFSHLHHAIGEEGAINTYISFSSDISDVARLRFIEELEEHNFKVIESVARISHLALEECRQRRVFSKLGVYFVLAATNENFYYSLYENKGSLFLRLSEGKLPGLGLDMRRRALVEMIVENVNQNSRLLSTREEIEQEFLRQDRFALDWLNQIGKSRPFMPIALPAITFAVAPNNPAVVQIIPTLLDERTSGLVNDIIRKISDFIRENKIEPYEIEGIVLIGEPFTNQTFVKALRNRFTINPDKIITYREHELPKIVNVYSQIDCDQFKGATTKFYEDAKTQAILLKQAKEEAERKKKAEEEILRQQELIESQKKADKEYRNAVENIERYESEHNYEEMLEWTDIALRNQPNDKYAEEKAALARDLLAGQRADIKHFNTFMQRAMTAFSEERWTDAISHCDMALELQPNSERANNIKNEARRKLANKEKIQNLLIRANTFFAQKLYPEALKEIEKIQNLESSNEDAKEIKSQIEDIKIKEQKRLNSLILELKQAESSDDFDTAINVCENLLKVDVKNIRKWTEKIENLKTKKSEKVALQTKLDSLLNQIEEFYKLQNWQDVVKACEEYLSIKVDKNVSASLSHAFKKIEEIEICEILRKTEDSLKNQDFEHALDTISQGLSIYPNNLILKNKQDEYSYDLKKRLENISIKHSQVSDAEKQCDYLKAINFCQELIVYDKEHKQKWQDYLQKLQSLQIEKSELENNFRRKKADLNVLIRQKDSSAEKKIKEMQSKYHSFGITKFDSAFMDLLKVVNPNKYKSHSKISNQESHKRSTPKRKTTNANKEISKSTNNIIQDNHQNTFVYDHDSEGYKLLKEGKFIEAKRHFATKEYNSKMSEICTTLIHLNRTLKKGTITESEKKELMDMCNKFNINL